MARRATRPPGRPSKLSDEVQEAIHAAISNGATIASAATAGGIAERTFHKWMQIGQADDAPADYAQFRDVVARARAELNLETMTAVMTAIRGGFLVKRVTRIGKGGEPEVEEQYAPPDGRLGLDLMSRVFPFEYARRGHVQVTDPAAAGTAVEQRFVDLAERITALMEIEASPTSTVVTGEVIDAVSE